MKHFATRYLASAALLNIAIAAYAGPITIVDQQNLAPVNGTNGGVLFGQSFTPTLSRIDAIEFLMGDDGTDVVKILNGLVSSDGLGGPVIGTSDPVSVHTPGFHEMIQFDFPLGVMLVPGQTYVALLSRQDGSGVEGVSFSDDLYPRGQFLEQAFSLDSFSRDMIFSEGLTPEPAPISLVALGLMALLTFRHFRLSRSCSSAVFSEVLRRRGELDLAPEQQAQLEQASETVKGELEKPRRQ